MLSLRAYPAIQSRIEELATKSTEGELTAADEVEYKGYARANKHIAMLLRRTPGAWPTSRTGVDLGDD